MKLFVNARFLTQPVSGVQRYGIECSRQIKRLYPTATFLAPKNIIHEDIAAELGVTVIGRNTGHLWEQVDLPLHLTGKKGAPLLNLANTAPIIYSNNYVCIHDMAFYHHPEWNSKTFSTVYNILIPRLALGSKHIFTVSESMKVELMKYYKLPSAKISVTYNGIAAHLLRTEGEQRVPKGKIVLAVGSFNARKNHPALIHAFLQSNICKSHQLIIVGDKNKVFSETGLDESTINASNVNILQHVSDDELRALYQKAEMLVSLSDYEGFGIPVLEGLYAGCRVLCSEIATYRELFDGCVIFCDQHNIPAIAAALDALSVNDDTFVPCDTEELLKKYNYERSARIMLGKIDMTFK